MSGRSSDRQMFFQAATCMKTLNGAWKTNWENLAWKVLKPARLAFQERLSRTGAVESNRLIHISLTLKRLNPNHQTPLGSPAFQTTRLQLTLPTLRQLNPENSKV